MLVGMGARPFLLCMQCAPCEILYISVCILARGLPNQIATGHPRGTQCFGLVLATSSFHLGMDH